MQPSEFYWCRVRKENRMMNNRVNGAYNIFFFNWWWFMGVLLFMFITCICHIHSFHISNIPKQKSPRQVPFLSLLKCQKLVNTCYFFQYSKTIPPSFKIYPLYPLVIIIFIRYCCFILYYFVLYCFILYYISLIF